MKDASTSAPQAAQSSVSIIIAALDAERFIGEAIESVLGQTQPPRELIVVDDGSADATAAIARSYAGVIVLSQPNAGPSAARNAGVRLSTGGYLGFLDADDLMAPGRLESQTAHLVRRPDVGLVFGGHEVRTEPGAELPFWAAGTEVPARDIGPADIPRVYHFSMLMRRETWERVGQFDESLRMAEDLDWTLRASEAGVQMDVLGEVVTIRRVHPDNVTHDAAASRDAMFAAFRKRIERNRARP